jgi:hypothetical protein
VGSLGPARRRQAEREAAEAAQATKDLLQEGAETGVEAGYVRKSQADDPNAPAGSVTAPDEDDDPPGMFADPELNRTFRDTMAYVIVELRDEWRGAIADAIKAERESFERALTERDRALTERDAKIARLEGAIDMLMAIVGQRSAAKFSQSSRGTDLDLPNWRQNN